MVGLPRIELICPTICLVPTLHLEIKWQSVSAAHRLYTCTQCIGCLEALLDEMGKASQPQASSVTNQMHGVHQDQASGARPAVIVHSQLRYLRLAIASDPTQYRPICCWLSPELAS